MKTILLENEALAPSIRIHKFSAPDRSTSAWTGDPVEPGVAPGNPSEFYWSLQQLQWIKAPMIH